MLKLINSYESTDLATIPKINVFANNSVFNSGYVGGVATLDMNDVNNNRSLLNYSDLVAHGITEADLGIPQDKLNNIPADYILNCRYDPKLFYIFETVVGTKDMIAIRGMYNYRDGSDQIAIKDYFHCTEIWAYVGAGENRIFKHIADFYDMDELKQPASGKYTDKLSPAPFVPKEDEGGINYKEYWEQAVSIAESGANALAQSDPSSILAKINDSAFENTFKENKVVEGVQRRYISITETKVDNGIKAGDNNFDLYIKSDRAFSLTDEMLKGATIINNVYIQGTNDCNIDTNKKVYNNLYAPVGNILYLQGSENTYRGAVYGGERKIEVYSNGSEFLSGFNFVTKKEVEIKPNTSGSPEAPRGVSFGYTRSKVERTGTVSGKSSINLVE